MKVREWGQVPEAQGVPELVEVWLPRALVPGGVLALALIF